MSASLRGMYCTAGYESSRKVSASRLSAMTRPPALTTTRACVGSIAIGCSGPGIFLCFSMTSPFVEREERRESEKCERHGVIPFERFAEISDREHGKYDERDHFLHDLELR